MSIARAPHRKCMRGLHWVYTTDPPLDPAALAARLEAAYEHRLVRGDEPWGPARVVIRLILQFEVEYRLGEAPGQISLIHRVSSSAEARERAHETLRGVLEDLLAAEGG